MCSSKGCMRQSAWYGSATAVAISKQAQMAKPSPDFVSPSTDPQDADTQDPRDGALSVSTRPTISPRQQAEITAGKHGGE